METERKKIQEDLRDVIDNFAKSVFKECRDREVARQLLIIAIESYGKDKYSEGAQAIFNVWRRSTQLPTKSIKGFI